MANTLGTIAVDLTANTAAFVEGLTRASSAAKKTGKDITESFSRLGDVLGSSLGQFGEFGAVIGEVFSKVGLLSGSASQSLAKMNGGMNLLTVGAGLTVGALAAVESGAIGLTLHTAEAAARMLVLSQQTGVSVETLSGFAFVAKQSGVDAEAMTKGLEKLNKSMFSAGTAPAGAVNAFTRLHVAVRDSNGEFRSTEDVFKDVAEKFAQMPDGPVKGALAIQLFGKAGAALIPILNQGKAGIEDFIETAKALGIVLDGATAEAAHRFEQSLNTISAAGQGLSIRMMRELLPAIQAVASGIVNALKDKGSLLNSLIDNTVWLTKVTFVLGDAFITAFEILSKSVGAALDDIANFSSTLGVMIEKAKGGDWKGVGQAVKDGLSLANVNAQQFSATFSKLKQDFLNFKDNTLGPRAPFTTGQSGDTKTNNNVDTSAAEKDKGLKAITDEIDKLRAKSQAELDLAATLGQSTAAQRLQTAEGEADVIIKRLQAQADNAKGAEQAKLIALIKSETSEIHALTAAGLVAKDAVTLNTEFAKTTQAYDAQIQSLRNLTIAYMAGGAAIADAEIEQKLQGEKEKLAVLTEEFNLLSQKEGVSSLALFDLATALDAANKQLELHGQQIKNVRSESLDKDIASTSNALREEAPLLQAEATAYLKSAEAVREFEVSLKTFQFRQANPGASDSQVNQVSAQYKQQAQDAYALQIVKSAAQFEIGRGLQDEMDKLIEIDKVLKQNGEDTLLVDAAIFDSQQKNIQQWDAAALKVGSYGEKFTAVMNQVALEGQNFGEKIAQSIGKAIDDVSTQLAKLVTTGKSNFKQLVQGLEESTLKSGIQKIFGTAASKLGFGGAGGKPDGSESKPFHVIAKGALGSGGKFEAIPPGDGDKGGGGADGGIGSIFNSVFSKMSSSFSGILGSITSIFSKIGGSLSGIFGTIFGGFLAGGGDVTPGKAYIVGEKHPEFFVPRQAGQVAPSLKTGGGDVHHHYSTVNFHFPPGTDADSFRKSQGQISGDVYRMMAMAHSRTR